MLNFSGTGKPQILSRLGQEWGTPHPSLLAAALDHRRVSGLPLFDLITANPQEHGLAFPHKLLSDTLASATDAAQYYRPDPRGQPDAREAVACYHGQGVPADHVILTPGTSLGYYFAFRLLAKPGDEILCPSPTYPLFEDLARLAGLHVRYYHLEADRGGGHWTISPEELAFQITPRTRALVLVSPHNPTGSIASAAELETIAQLARSHHLPIIFDEVFRECVHGATPVLRPSAFGAPLTITLNGLSKMLSLPGLKAGWLVAEGDPALRDSFLAAAEYMCDLFLPVTEVTQAALPQLLTTLPTVGAELSRKYTGRMRAYAEAWRTAGFTPLATPEGTPYLCVPLPNPAPSEEEPVVLNLLTNAGVLTHPGQLYRMPSPHLITTCVHQPPWPLDAIAKKLLSAP